MMPMRAAIYRLGEIEVIADRGIVLRQGQEIYLRPKTLQVLLFLIESHQRLVTKEELMEAVWKDTAVTDDALVQSITEIRRVLGDDPRNPRYIKTFPRAGYRFIGPVEKGHPFHELMQESETIIEAEYEEEISGNIETENGNATTPVEFRRLVRSAWLRASVALVSVATVAVLGYFSWRHLTATGPAAGTAQPQIVPLKSLAVMYLENRTQTAELDWLREGLADMLITGLARAGGLDVVSRPRLAQLLSRAGASPGAAIPPDQAFEVARIARADMLLTGGFARLGDRMRIDVQVQDVRTAKLLGAESLVVDRPEEILSRVDLFSVRLAERLGLGTRDLQPLILTDNLEAYRCYSLAMDRIAGYQAPEGIALLEKATALDPQFAMAHARIGYAYAIAWIFPEKARPYLEKAFSLPSRLTERDRLSIAAWYAVANQDWEGAVKAYRQLLGRYPADIEVYLRLALLLVGEERYDEALEIYRRGLTVDPESAELYNSMVGPYIELGRHKEAVAAAKRYVELAPSNANARDTLALALQWAGRHEDAISEFKAALALNPRFEVAALHLGNIYFTLGRYREAIRVFESGIAMAHSDEERARGFTALFWIYWKKGDLARARTAAREEERIRPGCALSPVILALEEGRFQAAAELLPTLVSEKCSRPRGQRLSRRLSLFPQGSYELRTGRTEEALRVFRELVRHRILFFNIEPMETCLADALLGSGRAEEATAEYSRVLARFPDYPRARFGLGLSYARLGEATKARAELGRFLELWKDADRDIPELLEARRCLDGRAGAAADAVTHRSN